MAGPSALRPLRLPAPMQRWVDDTAAAFLRPAGVTPVDFARPEGEEALVPASSVSWRVFKNPVVLLVGGISAVVLELAEPRVRSGVWEHTSFRTHPVGRLQRTGLAALVTVYGARSVAEPMIAGIGRMHDRVAGTTPAGEAYRASDAELLAWVHATACFGFAEAYGRYVHPLGDAAFDRFLAEGVPASRLYGVPDAPGSRAELETLFASMHERLEPSPVLFQFLDAMRHAPILPASLRPLQGMLVRAAVELVPVLVRQRVGLTRSYGLRRWEEPAVRLIAHLADRVALRSGPAAQSCVRLGLPSDTLYRG